MRESALPFGRLAIAIRKLPMQFDSSTTTRDVIYHLRKQCGNKAAESVHKKQLLGEYVNRLGLKSFPMKEQKEFLQEAKRLRGGYTAGEMLRATIKKDIEIDSEMIEIVMEAFASKLELPKIRYLRRLMKYYNIQPTGRTANALMNCYISKKDSRRFYSHLDGLLSSGYQPTESTLLSLMQTASNFDNCMRCYKEVGKYFNVVISMSKAAVVLLDSCVFEEEIDKANNFYFSLEKNERTIHVMNALIRLYSLSFNYESCIKLITSKDSPNANTVTYTSMLMQCHSAMIVNRSTEPWSSRAESLWLAAYHSNLINTNSIFESYLMCLSRTGDLNKANSVMELFKIMKGFKRVDSRISELYNEIVWRDGRNKKKKNKQLKKKDNVIVK